MMATFEEAIELRELWEGWFEAECDLCGVTTTGSEPTLDDWAWEHAEEHETDILRAGFPG